MKHFRKLLSLICLCALLLPSVPLEARAQKSPLEDPKATEVVVDAYITVMTMAYPPAGGALKAAKSLMDMLGFFKKPDAVGEALKQINQRLDELERRMSQIEDRLQQLENRQYREANLWRITRLRDIGREIDGIADALQLKPTDKTMNLGLVRQAQIQAEKFLDQDPGTGQLVLWSWSDMALRDHQWGKDQGRPVMFKAGQMLPPDFKPMPALEYYVTALATWMAAIEYAADGDYEFVKRTFGAELRKHIEFLSVRPGWHDFVDEPKALPEHIKKRIGGLYEPTDIWPDKDRICAIAEFIKDSMGREIKRVGSLTYTAAAEREMCNVPQNHLPPTEQEKNEGRVRPYHPTPAEDELERAYGMELMTLLAANLTRLRDHGTVREQLIGEFDHTSLTHHFLYAVKPGGELLWYMHRTATRRKPAVDLSKIGVKEQSKVPLVLMSPSSRRRASAPRTYNPNVIAGAQQTPPRQQPYDPRLINRNVVASQVELEVSHSWDGPKQVGTGWQNFRDVIPAGLNGIYALTQDGLLKWYAHDGVRDGIVKWRGPTDVGQGWNSFVRIVPAGDGILYGIEPDGTLKWHKHGGFRDGSVSWSWPVVVGSGWAGFTHVFSGGEGVIYAVTPDGTLKWYRHKGYLSGAVDWEGPRDVGSGWQMFKRIFSPGDGVIYGIKPTGEMLWYTHTGRKDGSVNWQGPTEIAADWKDFLYVFPTLPAAPSAGDVIR